ncbi:unnamed protein product [Ectocarpus sp. CCAP 1310/34]|nr:unnamed protein product [Ectocarpus sp. CCAP 1310/34]
MDALRREAHRLEADLEVKTQSYSRLAQRVNSDILYDAEDPVDSTQEQLLAGEIDELLSALGDCNERMGAEVAKGARKADSAMLQRYREILFDFSTEFKKTSAALQRKRDTAELFKSSRADRGGGDGTGDFEQEHLLREQNAIHNSLQSATGVLGQAAEARESLRHQRATLGAASSTLSSMQNRFPAINRVVEAIQKKKAKDRLIIAAVMAACIFFTFWYKGWLL